MLQAIRERAQSFVAWVIIILIAVPFAFWGIQNYFDVGKEIPVAVVGDQELFQRDVNRVYQQNTQNPLVFVQYSEDELQQQALEQLINDEVIGQISSDLGFAVGDQTVRDFNKSLPYFQTDGKFDKEKYTVALSSQGQSSAWFIEKVRRGLVLEQFRNGILNSEFVTQRELNRVVGLRNQQREIDYIIVPAILDSSTIGDSEVTSYYQNHKNTFKNPEQVSIEYIELNLEKLAADIVVEEDDLRSNYDSSKESYTTPERRKVSHILKALDSKAELSEIAAMREKMITIKEQIESGEPFESLAKRHSDDKLSAKKGGDLGFMNPGDMEKNFEEAASKLSLGEVSNPIKTAFGFHLIKVTELTPSKTKSFSQVRTEISETLRRNEAENLFYELGEILAEKSYEDPSTLEVAAQAVNIKIAQSGLFSSTQGDGISAEQKIRDAAFSTDVKAGNNSEPIELSDERVIVLRVKEHRIPSAKSLSEVKGEIVEKLKAEKARSKAKQTADAVYGELETGRSISEVAKQYELQNIESKIINRQQKDISSTLLNAVFEAPKPSEGKPNTILVEQVNGDQAVVNLTAVRTVGADKISDSDRESLRKLFVQVSGQSLYSSIVAEGRTKLSVEVINREETK